ncbi:hypothetical protein ACFP1F_08895 [Companilactobacillus baiquanensis]|uniref:Replicative DNA helicase n=2 Tax=Companilactobacillus baiquanensis TaxID=2486005 RepID=A0ABW1UVV8_9LACO
MNLMVNLDNDLRDFLIFLRIGNSRDHPLVVWNVLNILYGGHSVTDSPQTLEYIIGRYNSNSIDEKLNEPLITNATLKNILERMADEGGLVEVTSRKVRVRMTSGAYHMRQASIYRITSKGIEFIKTIPKILEAENTVTANVSKIDEYCELIDFLCKPNLMTNDTKLYNSFNNMISAYSDVFKGMHKLSEDLDEISNDLAFNHANEIAENLNKMLKNKAIPAFKKITSRSENIQYLSNQKDFPNKVARSRYGEDNLDAEKNTNNYIKIQERITSSEEYVRKQLKMLSHSFEPTATAMDNNYDSIYIIYNTIINSIRLLGKEYDHLQEQTVDIKELNHQIDELMINYQSISFPKKLPKHLAYDRQVDDPDDLLKASILGPVSYQISSVYKKVATFEDNPVISEENLEMSDLDDALKEFQDLVMKNSTEGEVNHDLELETIIARDEIMKLYSATGYDNYEDFSPFGRPIKEVRSIDTGPIRLHFKKEKYSVHLPRGFNFKF